MGELTKFRVTSKTGEIREQLGLKGVVAGDKVTFIDYFSDDYLTEWVVTGDAILDEKTGLYSCEAKPVS